MEKIINNILNYTKELIGLPVSLPWMGYGSAIFLELGKLEDIKTTRQNHQKGEACISVSWDWRFEKGVKVLFGSSNTYPEIDNGIQILKGSRVHSIETFGSVQELIVRFDNDLCLRTMVMISDNPKWDIRIKNEQYLYSKNGCLYYGEGTSELTDDEKINFEIAENTAKRWGVPILEPKKGNCSQCNYYKRIDGEANFLDYGVCISSNSKFDGHIVNVNSGCPLFRKN